MRPPVENGKFIDMDRKYCGCVAKEGVVTGTDGAQSSLIPPPAMRLKIQLENSSPLIFSLLTFESAKKIKCSPRGMLIFLLGPGACEKFKEYLLFWWVLLPQLIYFDADRKEKSQIQAFLFVDN
jgi:hypothetical protein